MLTPTLIHRYGIIGTFDRISSRDHLWENTERDPIIQAYSDADYVSNGHPYALSVAIGPSNTCTVQIILFRDELGYWLYMNDEETTIFEQKEI